MWSFLSTPCRWSNIRKEQNGSFHYDIRLKPAESGSIGYGVRVLPSHAALGGKHDMGLIRWG